MIEYKSLFKEAIRYHENMPKEIEKVVESIRSFSKRSHWTFDCLIEDIPKLKSIGVDISDIPSWILKLPGDFGIGFAFEGNSYNNIVWSWDVYIPFDADSLLYYNDILNYSRSGKPDEFGLTKGKYGTYLRVWWD